MTGVAATQPRRLTGHELLVGRFLYIALFVLCVGMFAISTYGQAVQWAFGDCGTLYTEPGWENACEDWRAAILQSGFTLAGFQAYFILLRVFAALPFIALSLLLIRRRGEELRVLLLAAFLLLLGVAGPVYNPFWQWSRAWFSVENQVPLLLTLSRLLDFLLSVGLVLFALLFPDGRFVPRWTRWIAALWIVLRFGTSFFPETPASVYTWPHSLGLIMATPIEILAIASFVWRYARRADAVQRQQIKWIIAGGLLLALNYFFDYGVWEIYPALTGEWLITTRQQGVAWELAQDTLWYVSQTLFALCVGLAVFRHRLWDIDLILSRTLVYGALTALVVGLYILIVGGIGALFHTQATAINGLLATGIIAVLFQPLRDRLQRFVNRLLYGERDDPAAVFSRLAHQLETANARSAILPNLVQAVASTLKIPYVAIRLASAVDHAEPLASWGLSTGHVEVIPLVYQNEAVGQLAVALRGPQEAFNPQEQRLLAAIAALTATTVRAVQMSDEVHFSRQRIITAREEERRRIRRDLHDGLGPALASLPLKIDAAVDLLAGEQQRSVRLLGDVKRQAQQLVADVRRVVHDLRPPALDELGLADALRSALSQLIDHPNGMQISLAADSLPPHLPAAAEVASYHITLEAVTNVIKHARAQHCWVSMQVVEHPPQLHIDIEDDGIGITSAAVPNVGLHSMRERAEELGGSFQLHVRPSGGTRIAVSLPLSKTRAAS
jgi:signal transduction histidine kinase